MKASYFARTLREKREAAGLSQYSLAKLAGLSKSSLSLLELGKRIPNWDTVQRLAKALGLGCNAFEDPNLDLPEDVTLREPGRPKAEGPQPKKPRGKRKGK
jgi:transcriptional regulator with XRE-family HTH domain